jgi:small subunit ribosomal protein S20
MPHIPVHPSAERRHRQSIKRQARNQAVKSRVRTAVKQVSETLTGSDNTQAELTLRKATKEIYKAASKGVIHRNTAARKVARLARRLHQKAAKAAQPQPAAS